MEELQVHRLKEALGYLKSKQRELKKKETENDTRSIESLIKYLKKDMVDQFDLTKYDLYIKQDVNDTETFISSVQHITDSHS